MSSASAPAKPSARLLTPNASHAAKDSDGSVPDSAVATRTEVPGTKLEAGKAEELAAALTKMHVSGDRKTGSSAATKAGSTTGQEADSADAKGSRQGPQSARSEKSAASSENGAAMSSGGFDVVPGRIRELDAEHYELEMEIHNKLVGRIIGKGGASIRELQDRTHTQIFMPKIEAESETPSDADRTVRIVGALRDIRHCGLLIQLKTVSREDTERIDQLSEALKEFQPVTTRSMKIPSQHVGRVIGKNGQTIRQIQELSGAQIDLPKESRPGEDFRVLTVTGTEPEVNYCCQLLQIKITPREEGGAAGPGPNFSAFAPGGITTLRIHIPADQVGRVIGRRGAHIRELQDESGAMIYLPRDSIAGTSVREITLIGTPEAVSKCQYLLQRKLTPPDQELEPLMTIPPAWPAFMPPQPLPFPIADASAMPGAAGAVAGQAVYPTMYPSYMDPGYVPSSGHPEMMYPGGFSVSPPIYRRPPPNMMMSMAGTSSGMPQAQPVVMPQFASGADDRPHVTQYSVPENQLARLIGQSGEGLKELSQQTGAYLSFLPHVPGDPYIVVIQGLPQQIFLARSMIQARLGGI